jgi:hypothetical protein
MGEREGGKVKVKGEVVEMGVVLNWIELDRGNIQEELIEDSNQCLGGGLGPPVMVCDFSDARPAPNNSALELLFTSSPFPFGLRYLPPHSLAPPAPS